jgi:hypothetical protein
MQPKEERDVWERYLPDGDLFLEKINKNVFFDDDYDEFIFVSVLYSILFLSCCAVIYLAFIHEPQTWIVLSILDPQYIDIHL